MTHAPFSADFEPDQVTAMMQLAILNRLMNAYGGGETVHFEMTQDVAQIYQYQRMADLEHGAQDDEAQDAISVIFTARRGNLCLGGARVTIREHDESFALPMEAQAFDLRENLPSLALSEQRHAEISRFSVMEDCGIDVFSGLCKAIIDHLIAAQVPYAFIASSLVFARAWAKEANLLAAGSTSVKKDVALPQAEESEVISYLTVSDFSRYSVPEGWSSVSAKASLVA